MLRGVPGVPLLLLDRSVMVLETPSEASMRAKAKVRLYGVALNELILG